MNASSLPVAVDAQVDPTVFLMGRPPMHGSVQWLQQSVEGQQADVSELADHWRAANARIKLMSDDDSLDLSAPDVTPLPPSLASLGQAVLEHPATKQAFGWTRNSIEFVELENLIVFQRNVNLTYAAELQAALGESPSAEDLFHFALPTDGRYDPIVNAAPTGAGPTGPLAFAMVSPSQDLRVLKTGLLDASLVEGFAPNGRPTHIIAVAVGYGTNYLSAMRVGSRFILCNGTHRAFALLAAGHTHAAMLIQEIPSGEEKDHLPPMVQADLDAYLTARRPPLARDYLDDDLRTVVQVPRTARSIRVGLSYEEAAAPGL